MINALENILFRHQGKKSSTHARPLKELTAISTPLQLLSEGKRHELVEKIKESSALDISRFDHLCIPLIYNLANHCQHLPETAHSYYAQSGGLIEHALNRTEAALTLFREYVVQEGSDLSDEQKLWLYALFSAGLLQGIGKLKLDYQVELFDMNGQFLKQWNPLLENLSAVGRYYRFEFQAEYDDDLRRRLNLLFARQLMPASGFAWIASNPQVLAIWLALLHEDWQSAGTLGAILIRADAVAIQRYLNDVMIGVGARSGRRITTFGDSTPTSVADIERSIGIEFIQWITKSLAAGQIMVNKAPLFMVPGGMLMSVDMYKLFVREHPEYKNWQAIQNGFLSLGLHSVGPDGNVETRFEQPDTQQMHSGVVFSDYAVALPEKMHINDTNTGKASAITAVELVHLMAQAAGSAARQQNLNQRLLSQLNAAGQWEQMEEVSAYQLGTNHSG